MLALIRQPKLWLTTPARSRGTPPRSGRSAYASWSETLGLAPATFAAMFGGAAHAVQAMRMNFYTPCLSTGLTTHSDGSVITVLQLTNGSCKSVEHRAVTDSKQDRLPIVSYAPPYDIKLGPLALRHRAPPACQSSSPTGSHAGTFTEGTTTASTAITHHQQAPGQEGTGFHQDQPDLHAYTI